tara:strand:- start:4893 stop:5369 length:477 start_codon:yes stop_codon:yes gene_type:complete
MISWKRKKIQWLNAGSDQTNFQEIISKIDRLKDNDIYVGCDSHKKGGVYIFAVVIALHLKGKGGTFFFYRNKSTDKQLDNLRMRLMKETELAVKAANDIREHIQDRVINVHLDINPKTKYPSSVVLPSAIAWVKSCGFDPSVKPNAWASSWLADIFAR